MVSPLASFQNARLLITEPGARGGPETGYRREPGGSVVVGAFLKQASMTQRAEFAQLEASSVARDILAGYVLNFAPLPDGADWLTFDMSAAPGYDDTAKRPTALRKGIKLEGLIFGSRESAGAEVIESAGTFDDLGIGEIVRNVIGDRLVLACEWRE